MPPKKNLVQDINKIQNELNRNMAKKQNMLMKMNPITQSERLISSVDRLQKSSFNILFTLIKTMDKLVRPCDMSKFVTDQICTLQKNANLDSVKKNVQLFKDTVKFKEVMDLAKKATKAGKDLLKLKKQKRLDFWKATDKAVGLGIALDIEHNEDGKQPTLVIGKQGKQAGGMIKLFENVNKISNITNNNQQGGGNNKYKFIINPINNKKVKLNSKKGKEILKMYLTHLV